MDTGNYGQILALVGLILVMFTGWGRRRLRDRKQALSPTTLAIQYWAGTAGFLMILAGLVLMSFSK